MAAGAPAPPSGVGRAAAARSAAFAGPRAAAIGQAAAGTRNADPWWFEDGYTSLGHVDAAATTAAVDPSGTGTVSLPTVPAGLAFDPAASVAVVASADGVRGWAFDGSAMVRAPRFDVAGGGFLGAAWVGGTGGQLAVATASRVALEAWTGFGWRQVASLDVTAATGVAGGPPLAGSPATVLVGLPFGFEMASYRSAGLAVDAGAGVSGLRGASGLAAARGGALVAVWAADRVRVYAWDGNRYREEPALEPPRATAPVQAVAWFRGGGGLWVLTEGGGLTAYALGGPRPVRAAALSGSLSGPVLALGTGWRPGAVAALAPGGWTYFDGAPLVADASRSVHGLTLPVYAPRATLQSTVLGVGHPVAELQVDAALVRLPAGTSVAYQVSTDGGVLWRAVTPCLDPTDPRTQCGPLDTAVPPGAAVVYRLLLATADPTVSPVVDTTDLYEIATLTRQVPEGRTQLIR